MSGPVTAGLNIAALARRTGVPADTLRKWEQRYSILQPARTPGGQRRYSERDVARVEWLRERLSEGYRIGEAASLLGGAATTPARTTGDRLRTILSALRGGDASEVAAQLDQALALRGVDETLVSLVCPLLAELGERWERGEIGVADEHLATEAVRSRLGHLIADAGGGIHGTAVLACAPGERHELGLMMVAIALQRDGWQVLYLGPDTPPADALALARRVSARLVGFSLCRSERAAELERALAGAERPAGAALLLGGAAATEALARRLDAAVPGAELDGIVRAVRKYAA